MRGGAWLFWKGKKPRGGHLGSRSCLGFCWRFWTALKRYDWLDILGVTSDLSQFISSRTVTREFVRGNSSALWWQIYKLFKSVKWLSLTNSFETNFIFCFPFNFFSLSIFNVFLALPLHFIKLDIIFLK